MTDEKLKQWEKYAGVGQEPGLPLTVVQAYHVGALYVEAQMAEGFRQWSNIRYHAEYVKDAVITEAVQKEHIRELRQRLHEISDLIHQ